jgi:hypothetical protein
MKYHNLLQTRNQLTILHESCVNFNEQQRILGQLAETEREIARSRPVTRPVINTKSYITDTLH